VKHSRTRLTPSAAGFTIIELLVVVAILAVVAAIALPALLRARVAANESSAIGTVRSIQSKLFAKRLQKQMRGFMLMAHLAFGPQPRLLNLI